jgi:hypothetical protein
VQGVILGLFLGDVTGNVARQDTHQAQAVRRHESAFSGDKTGKTYPKDVRIYEGGTLKCKGKRTVVYDYASTSTGSKRRRLPALARIP